KASSARETEIQSSFAAPHVAPRDQVIIDAAKNAQTPLRIPSRQSPHAATPDRYRHRSNRLQEPRSPEKIRQRKRQNPSPSSDWHAGLHAPQNHARDQAQPLGAVDEITVEAPRRAPVWIRRAFDTTAATSLRFVFDIGR